MVNAEIEIIYVENWLYSCDELVQSLDVTENQDEYC